MSVSIARDGRQIGAWPEAEVRRMLHDGQLLASDLFWREGMAQWEPLAELVPIPPPVPTATPPVVSTSALRQVGPIRKPVRRSSPAVWAVPVGLLFFAALGWFSTVVFRSKMAEQRFAREMNNFTSRQGKEDAEQMARNGYISRDEQETKAEASKLRALANQELEPTRSMSEFSVQMFETIQSRVRACQAAEKTMLVLGLKSAQLASPVEIQRRLDAISACHPPIQALIDYAMSLDAQMRTYLAARHVSAAQIEAFSDGLRKSGKFRTLAGYWQSEESILDDIYRRLDLLKSNWGKWRMGDRGQVIFDDSGTQTAYEVLITKFRQDVVVQRELSRAAVGRAKP